MRAVPRSAALPEGAMSLGAELGARVSAVTRRMHVDPAGRPGLPVWPELMTVQRNVVDHCARALMGEGARGGALELDSQAQRIALRGGQLAGYVTWLRMLEDAVTEAAVGILGEGSVVRTRGTVRRVFDAVLQQEVSAYAETNAMSALRERLGHELVALLVSGSPLEPSLVAEHARQLGLDGRHPVRAIVARGASRQAGAGPAGQLGDRVATVLAELVEPGQLLTARHGDYFVAICPSEGVDLVGILGRLLTDQAGARGVIAVGDEVREITLAQGTARPALSAARLAWHRELWGTPVLCTDLVLDILLMSNPYYCRKIIDSALGGLEERPHLVATIRALIEAEMSIQLAAERLVIHPNTVSYRLRQIAELTGKDPRQLATLTEFRVAFLAEDVLLARQAT